MKYICILFCVILLASCATNKEHPENWQTNEVFTQLSELRQEIKVLKRDVKGLKEGKDNTNNRIEIDLRNTFPLGQESAKYAIVEFTDYQCPYCLKHSKKIVPKIKQQFIDSGVIKYFIKDFPLSFHGQAKKAAIASRCSGQQGKFWKMHEMIISNNKKLSENVFLSFASQLNIDILAFKNCLKNPDIEKMVDADISEGDILGVQGTPAFFIGRIKNNKLIVFKKLFGSQSFSSFSKVINTMASF